MALVLKPPHPLPAPSPAGRFALFLAGSIEMGRATDWQTTVTQALAAYDVLLFNPRRDDWDSSWVQSKDTAVFREQVEWELTALEQADLIAFYFDPTTQAPITLLELGLFGRTSQTVVCCPNGFWRK
ncbi:MAG: nucleoside 2-deoxyribosyltransferase domain-containing protein, partial [Anaerolineales bacterium]|nr:nucleoside 2-deoxyribosyltransferase domain-containing protein [Anaerolineales bacterium]